ncbi:efflux RND transporter permease subunit [Gracilimonas mengyeensis]|uniref:Multidrug efflux pump subunit AcrB n=1 Tax=Gracilimonas mengyeensis TaxID=1302730 RepID=A0A521BV69_9BACT|nr:efflux RND transporter permease subunit [Gracilimonas mengyeensis]SMO51059.1 Multidrug efflux pump subunit AcrB [Gracilimonas mengyeensis]
MLKRIVSTFVKYPFYGKLVIITLILLGVISYSSLNKATFPIVESRTITVTVSYPGATPEQMEEGVTTVIEEEIRGIPGIKEFESQSLENSATITIEGQSNYDIDELYTDVKNSVDGISNMPTNAEQPIVSKNRRTDLAMFLSLTSNNDDLMALHNQTNRIEEDLLASGFISQISVTGFPNTIEMAIEIDETQLERYGLTFEQIQSAIANNNIDIHGGTIRNPREELLVVSRNRSVDASKIANIVVITHPDGRLIRLGDVATVNRQFEESPNVSYVEGERNVTIQIQKLANEDLEEISNYVNDYIEEFNTNHDDYELTVMQDFLQVINNQLSILASNGLMGILLVFISLSLLLNYRLSLWVAWGIPASFLGMFIVGYLAGITINMISLFGMILIIGILVDDGIVIGENIFTHYERGKSPERAAVDGTMEILPAVFTSISTTIIAFIPLIFITGTMEMMKEMAIVVVAALGFSLVEGMFVLPGHLISGNALQDIKKKSLYGRFRDKCEKYITWVREQLYLPLLKRSLNLKSITLAITLSVFMITGGLIWGGYIPMTFFPSPPSDSFTIDLALKPGVNEEITQEKLFEVERAVWEANQKFMESNPQDTISYVDLTQVTVGSAFTGTESGTHAGNIRVFLNDDMSETSVRDGDIKNRISEIVGEIPEAYKFGVGASNQFGAPVEISLFGRDAKQLESASSDLKRELRKMSALYNVLDNSQLGSQEIRISLKPQAYNLGFNYNSLMQQVRSAYFGALAQRIQDGRDELWVYVRYPESNRKTLGQLETMQVKSEQGSFPLNEVANLEKGRSLNRINHYNGRREIRVEAYLRNSEDAVPPILDYIDKQIMPDIMENYPDVTYMHQGQSRESGEEVSHMAFYFGVAFLVIVLIIMLYFRSAMQGIIILIMIPFGAIGAVWGHGIHQEPLSLMSLWGLIALSGTIINDAIIYLAKYNQNLQEGQPLMEAIFDAARNRFRPLLLTTVTTTIGLSPLILESSGDAKMLVPMAIALAYGIFFGTFFILMLLPHVILLINRVRLFIQKMKGNTEATAESIEPAVINYKIEQQTDV